MKLKAVSGIMLTLLLIGITLAFNIQSIMPYVIHGGAETLPWEDDFESGSLSAWTSRRVSAGETATVVDTFSYREFCGDLCSAKFTSNGDAINEYAFCKKTIEASSEVYARGYFWVNTSGVSDDGDHCYFMVFRAGRKGVAFAGWRQKSGVVKWTLLIRDGTGWRRKHSLTSPSLRRWYCVELHWVESATAGYGEMWVDNTLVCSISGKDTTAFGSVNRVDFGLASIRACGSTEVYVDYCALDTWRIGQIEFPYYFCFKDNFESGGFNRWAGAYATPGETLAVVQSLPHDGVYSAKFMSDGKARVERAYIYGNEEIIGWSSYSVKGYFRVTSSGIVDNDDRFYLIALESEGKKVVYAGVRCVKGITRWELLMKDGDNWRWIRSTDSPVLNRWYKVVLHYTPIVVPPMAELWINDVLVCDGSELVSTIYDPDQVDIGITRAFECESIVVYADDCSIYAMGE